jgi:hypothetical protein
MNIGLTLSPGVYCTPGGAMKLSSGTLYVDVDIDA